MSFTPVEQHLSTKRLYDPHRPSYNNSCHPSFTKTFVSHLPIKPGQRILDLAYGTGLISFPTASTVSPSGCVIGVDVSEGMLAQAISRKEREEANFPQLKFHNHHILDLRSLKSLSERSFDLHACIRVQAFPQSESCAEALDEILEAGKHNRSG